MKDTQGFSSIKIPTRRRGMSEFLLIFMLLVVLGVGTVGMLDYVDAKKPEKTEQKGKPDGKGKPPKTFNVIFTENLGTSGVLS